MLQLTEDGWSIEEAQNALNMSMKQIDDDHKDINVCNYIYLQVIIN